MVTVISLFFSFANFLNLFLVVIIAQDSSSKFTRIARSPLECGIPDSSVGNVLNGVDIERNEYPW